MAKGKCYDTAKCPFYLTDSTFSITCEGLYDYSYLGLRFNAQADKNKQTKLFCCEEYNKCELYKLLMRAKYSD